MRTNNDGLHGCDTFEKINAVGKTASRRHALSTVEFSSSCPALFVYGSNTSVSNRRSSSPFQLKKAQHRPDCNSQVRNTHMISFVHIFLITVAEQNVSNQKQHRKKDSLGTIEMQSLRHNIVLLQSEQGPRELNSEFSSLNIGGRAEHGAPPINKQYYGQAQTPRSEMDRERFSFVDAIPKCHLLQFNISGPTPSS